MRKKSLIATCLIAFSAPVFAEPEPTPPAQSTMERLGEILSPSEIIRGQISEQDVSELFAVLRSQIAGNPRELSPELKRKLDALAQRLQIRGALAGSLLLDELETQMRKFVRELNEPPPSKAI